MTSTHRRSEFFFSRRENSMELFMFNRSYFTDTIFRSEFHRHGVRSSDIAHDRTLSREVKFLVKVMRTRENVTEEMTLESTHHFYKEFSCTAGLKSVYTGNFSTFGFLLLTDVKQ